MAWDDETIDCINRGVKETSPMTAKCWGCGEEKPISEFATLQCRCINSEPSVCTKCYGKKKT